MLSNATVSVISVETTTDDLGNGTIETTELVLEWALVAPRSSDERSDPRSPAVVTAASIYGPFATAIDADDLIVVADHSPSMNGEWQIDGRSGDWSLNGWKPGFEVAVKRASSS